MHFCLHCGAQYAATAKFCPNCGKSVSGALTPSASQPVPSQPSPLQGTLSLQSLLNNRYLIVRLLGQGGMGAVYLAQDQNAFNRRCVVKEMLPYYQNQTEQRKAEQDFEREARVLASIRYDGVPQVYEYFIENGRYYLVMEFVEGENLEERMARIGHALPEDEVLAYALQLTNILVYLSRQTPPVIHRDIKPANIILDDEQNKVKLVDFGLAKETGGSGMTGGMSIPLGTPGYAPPEQYSGKVEPRTDVYGLGATLHHLLSGRDPRNETPFDFPALSQLLPGISAELDQLIGQMVEANTAVRPGPREVRDALERLVRPSRGAAVTAQPFVLGRSGAVAQDPNQLALIFDANWDEGVYHLYAGHLEPWLESHSRNDLAVRARTIRTRSGDRSAGLEEFLRAANPTIALPSLAVSTTTLDLGQVNKGANISYPLRIKNVGRGYINGQAVAKVDWTTVRPSAFGLMAGQEMELSVSVDTAALDEEPLSQPVIEITSNGGQEIVSCTLEVIWQPALTLAVERLHLGDVLEDQRERVTTPLVISNSGGGVLSGHLHSDAPWLTLDVADFDIPSGQSLTVNVTAEPFDLGIQQSSGTIQITTGSATRELPAYVGVRKAWYDTGSRLQAWAAYTPLLIFGYFGQIVPLSMAVLFMLNYPLPGYSILGTLAIVLLLSFGAFYLSRRWVEKINEIENYYHRSDLAASLLTNQFTWTRLYLLGAAGGIFGLVAGWRFAAASPASGGILLWLPLGLLAGMAGGALLGAMGSSSPQLPANQLWLVRLWNGPTLDTSPTFASLRSVGLVVIGALFGAMLDVITGHGLRPAGAIGGGVAGMILASDGQRLPALRVRWLLQFARLALLIALGAIGAMSLLQLIRFSTVWPVIRGYGGLALQYPGIGVLLWIVLLLIGGIAGVIGMLWVANGESSKWPGARRTFLGLLALLLTVTFPVYLLFGLLFMFIPAPALRDWALLLASIGAATTAAWAVGAQRRQMEAVWRQAQSGLTRSTGQLSTLTQSQIGGLRQLVSVTLPPTVEKIWRKLVSWLAWVRLPAFVQRLRPQWTLPSLHELEANATLPLIVSAAVAAVILQRVVTMLLIGATVGIGILVLYILIAIALLVGLFLLVRYLRSRP